MNAIEIRMHWKGRREFEKLLVRVEKAGHNLSNPLTRSAFYMQDSVMRNFEEGGRPKRWKDWTAGYSAWRHRMGRPSGILILDLTVKAKRPGKRGRVYGGDLRKGIHIPPVGRDYAMLSTGRNAPYAKAHQFGHGPVPARPYMLFQDDDATRIEGFFQDWLEEVISR